MQGPASLDRQLIPALLLVCFLGCFGSHRLAAQADAAEWRSGSVKLDQGWRVHAGDDLAWAQPGFDDTGWQQVDIDNMGAAEIGWRWYRLHIKLAPGHPRLNLLIVGGSGTFEIYANGKRLQGPRLQSSLRVARPTGQIAFLDDDAASLEISLRTYAPPIYESWHLPLFLTASVGTPSAIEDESKALESERFYAALPSIAINLAVIFAGIGAFALFGSQRNHSEYLWLGLYLVLLGFSNLLLSCTENGVISLSLNNLIADPLLFISTIMQIQFTFSFAGKQKNLYWRSYQGILLVPLLLNGLMWMQLLKSDVYLLIESIITLPAALLLPIFLLIWYKRGNREAGWLILPSLLPGATASIFNFGTVSIYFGWGFADFLDDPIMAGRIPLQLIDVGDILFVLAIGIVMFFRFTRVSREQTRAAAELEAARDLQHRLVPSQVPEVKGYTVEAAYFPAQEVGGDFYQVFGKGEGSRIVVVGDVSGKGLKAAMTGTLALGALRALAAEGLGPGAILERLNYQITETGHGGFITCVCLRIDESGEITVANAGHLPPYRNGEELSVRPDLPLGISASQRYEEQTFHLNPGDRLTLLSDGVLEARDAHGILFGFERTRAISAQGAAEIADKARQFGQEDDITVLTLAMTQVTHA
jgi:hypothetical protein